MRIAQLDKDNKVVNIFLVDSVEDVPRYVNGETANIGDYYNPQELTFTSPGQQSEATP